MLFCHCELRIRGRSNLTYSEFNLDSRLRGNDKTIGFLAMTKTYLILAIYFPLILSDF